MNKKNNDIIHEAENFMQENLYARTQQLKETGLELLLSRCFATNKKVNTMQLQQVLQDYPEIKRLFLTEHFKNTTILTPEQKTQIIKITNTLATQKQKLFQAGKPSEKTSETQLNNVKKFHK